MAPPSPAELRAEAHRLLGEDGLCETRASFNEADLVEAWAAALPHGASARRVRALASRLAHDPQLLSLDADAPLIGVPRRYTTHQLADIERRALALALDGRAGGAPAVSPDQARRAIDDHHPELSSEQRAMVTEALASADRVVCVIGHAGAGKTTGMRALHDILTRSEVSTLGAAPSGVAAEKLQQETGIPSSTLHRLVRYADRAGLPRRSVVVVDEAAMADTRTLHRLLDHATRAEGKVILVGDHAQLGAVGPGGLYPALVEQLGATSLTANHRQHDGAERDALRSLRDGAADDFLAYAAKAGRLTLAGTPDEARAALLADWHTAHQHEADSLMIAYRRIDVETLNHAARTLLRRDDQLGPDRHTTPEGRGFAIGDQVICLHNAPTLGVANGTRGELVAISRDGLTLRTPIGERQIPSRYADAGQLAHGYAITGHKSQGQTVSRAFVLAPDRGDLKEWAYVAASRARDETRIYLAQSTLDHEHEPPAVPVPDDDALERLAAAATRPANERLATDPPRERVARLVERRDALQRDLARAQRAERDAERAVDDARLRSAATHAAPAFRSPSRTRSAAPPRSAPRSPSSNARSLPGRQKSPRACEPAASRPQRQLARSSEASTSGTASTAEGRRGARPLRRLQLGQITSRVRSMTRPTRRSQGATPSHFRFSPHAGVPPVVEGSPTADDLLELISTRLAAGKRVSVWVADDESEITPREAAEMLGVSRQFVMRLISDGDLASRRLPGSSHRRVPVEAVVGLMRSREAAHTRLDEATQALDAAGVDYE